MRLRVAIHFAWPRFRPYVKLCLDFRLGSPTTVSRNNGRES